MKLTPSDLFTIGKRRYLKPRENKAIVVLFIGIILTAFALTIASPAMLPDETIYYQPNNPNQVVLEQHADYIVLNGHIYMEDESQNTLISLLYTIWATIPAICGFAYLLYIYWKGEKEGVVFRDENTVLKDDISA